LSIRHIGRRAAFGTAAAVCTLSAAAAIAAPGGGTSNGPNSPTAPYVLPVADGVSTKSLLTVGDAGATSDG
jgi:hypothetical protein